MQQHNVFNSTISMIRFRPVKASDRELIQRFTLAGERQNCDLSIANIISWRFLYDTELAIVEGYLCFRFFAGHHLAYMMPVAPPRQRPDGSWGTRPEDECPAHVLKALRDDSIAMGHPFLMLGVCRYVIDIVEKNFPDVFRISPDRDYSDYIYLREKLATLAGKKLQQKRNHCNKFRKLYPNYEYRELTPDLIPQCLALEEQWCTGKTDEMEENRDQNGLEELPEELRSMGRAFRRWNDLSLRGGAVFVEGKMVAFTYGCPINYNTFDVCVEKADTSYEGAYNIINQEFARHLPEQYVYLNREEDMGLEGLRKAKLSYRPERILEKYALMERQPLAQFEDQGRIKEETRNLWRDTFHDPEPFINLYFERVYRGEYNVCCQMDGRVVGALQTLPYTLKFHDERVRAAYVSGVSVREDYRRQDIGTNLMRQAHFQMYCKGIAVAALIPAEPWLYGWYGRCGYAGRIVCMPSPRIVGLPFDVFEEEEKRQKVTLLHTEEQFLVAQADQRMEGEEAFRRKDDVQGMLRIINAEAALKMYARTHKNVSDVIRVMHDRDIPMNNAYFVIANGTAMLTHQPQPNARILSIAELAEYIFKGEDARMTLMLKGCSIN